MSEIENADWIIISEIKDYKLFAELMLDLDKGECEAIVLAHEKKADYLIIDEKRGRFIAKSMGIKTIGILTQSKRERIIDKIKPDLDNLRNFAGLWIAENLYNLVLKNENELS